MGISRELTGTPWHVEKVTRSEGDEKRHKSRCYYHRKKDDYCLKYHEKCRGSAHCDYYTETPPPKDVPKKENVAIKPEVTTPKIEPLLPIGCRVHHKLYGKGVVTSITEETVTVLFDNNSEKLLNLKTLIKNKILTRED